MPIKHPGAFWMACNVLAAIILIGFIIYWLLVGHLGHLVEWLPLSILLLCSLAHIFIHRRHRDDTRGSGHKDPAHHNND
jgi:hypothetical protein